MEEQQIYCINHPERAALEKCEVCGKPLCGYCLYYTDDGQRLCEQHAQTAHANGVDIIPPAVYASGIIPAQADASRKAKNDDALPLLNGKKGARYQANDNDLLAFMSMTVGIITLSSCCGAGYCLPFLSLLIGIVALMNAKDSFNPRRTRQQAWIGIATGGCFVLMAVALIGLYVFVWGAAITSFSSNSSGPAYVFPTSTITPAPTYTQRPNTTPAPNIEPRQQTATARAAQGGQLMPLNSLTQTAVAVTQP